MNTQIWGYRCIRGGLPRHTPGSSWRRAGSFARLRMGRRSSGEFANGRGAPRVGDDRQLEPVGAGVACLARVVWINAAVFVRTFPGECTDISRRALPRRSRARSRRAPGELLESPRGDLELELPGVLLGTSCRDAPGDELPGARARAPGRVAGRVAGRALDYRGATGATSSSSTGSSRGARPVEGATTTGRDMGTSSRESRELPRARGRITRARRLRAASAWRGRFRRASPRARAAR